MAIALDVVSPSSSGQPVSFAASTNWSHTCTGSNLLLFVSAAFNSGPTSVTVTYGAQSLSQIATVKANGQSFNGNLFLFGLIAPLTGAHTITVTPNATTDMVCGGVSFAGCDQTTGWTNLTTATGSSSGTGTVTGTVPSVATGDWSLGVSAAANDLVSNAGTSLWNCHENNGQTVGNGAAAYSSSSGSNAINWSQSVSGTWAWLGVELIAAAAAGAAAPYGDYTIQAPDRWKRRFHPGWRQPFTTPPAPYPAVFFIADTDSSGATADAGEAVTATLSSSDTSGPELDGGEAVTATLSDSEASGPEMDAGENTGVSISNTVTVHLSRTWQERFRPPRKLIVPQYQPVTSSHTDSDLSGPELDGAESVAATLASQDASGSTDTGTTVGLGAADASGTTSDAGSVTAAVSDADASGAAADSGSLTANVPASDASGPELDGGESIAATLSDTEVSGPGLDGSEDTGVSIATTVTAQPGLSWKARFRHLFRPQVPFYVPPPPAPGNPVVTDSDAVLGQDSEIDYPFPVASDASGQAADGGEAVTALVTDSDASKSTDAGLQPGAYDTDLSKSTDAGYLSAAAFAQSDASMAFDVESRVFGPNAAPSDSDSCSCLDSGTVIGIYSYQPLNRWTGGYFQLRAPEAQDPEV